MAIPVDSWSSVRWLVFLNNSGATIPGFGCLQISGSNLASDTQIMTCIQPNGDTSAQYAINGAGAVAPGQYGTCTLDSPCQALYNSGSPALNETWGPSSGQWYLTKGNAPGFRVLGVVDSGTNRFWVQFPQSTIPKINFYNQSGQTAPSLAIMEVQGQTSIGGAPYLTIIQPTGSNAIDLEMYNKIYLVNTGADVANAGTGTGVLVTSGIDVPQQILYDTTWGYTPVAGETWGPVRNTWTLWRGAPGFKVLGNVTAAVAGPPAIGANMSAIVSYNERGTLPVYSDISSDTTYSAIPAFGAVQFASNNVRAFAFGRPAFQVKKCISATFSDELWGRFGYVNGPQTIDCSAGKFYNGSVLSGTTDPALVQVDTSVGGSLGIGHVCGVVPGSFKVARGLPGYIAVSASFTVSSIIYCWVVRDTAVRNYWAVATTNWWASGSGGPSSPSKGMDFLYVDSNPCVYADGTSVYTGITLRISLPCGPNKDPTIRTGDVVRWHFYAGGGSSTSFADVMAIEPYSDDAVGTIKLVSASTIARGWNKCDGTNGTVDLRDKFVQGSGGAGLGSGAATHTHTVTGAFLDTPGGGGPVIASPATTAAASSIPPNVSLYYIQRIN